MTVLSLITVLLPYCQECGKVCDIWIGTDGLKRYICTDKCKILNWQLPLEILIGTMISNANMYVNHCWNCPSGIDSRLPDICPRDEAEGRNDLFCCPNCGQSMRNFPGRRPIGS